MWSDEALVAGLRDNAAGAAEEYARRIGNNLFAFLVARTHDMEDAQDIHNQALYRAIRTWGAGRGASLRTWLYVLAKQELSEWAAEKAKANNAIDRYIAKTQEEMVALAGGATSSSRAAPYLEAVHNFVASLSRGEQQLYTLCISSELNDEQVAKILNIKIDSVKTMRLRMIRKIRNAFANQ